jgi:hypothetical protein
MTYLKQENTDYIQENVVSYICGFLVKKLRKEKNACAECIEIATTQVVSDHHSLVIAREYAADCLVKVSDDVLILCSRFEQHFKMLFANKIPHCNPRSIAIRTFLKKHDLCYLSLNCSQNHCQDLISLILKVYCTLRIFHHVKHFNRSMRKGSVAANSIKTKS